MKLILAIFGLSLVLPAGFSAFGEPPSTDYHVHAIPQPCPNVDSGPPSPYYEVYAVPCKARKAARTWSTANSFIIPFLGDANLSSGDNCERFKIDVELMWHDDKVQNGKLRIQPICKPCSEFPGVQYPDLICFQARIEVKK